MAFVRRMKQRLLPDSCRDWVFGKDILVIVNIDDVGLHPDETEASFRVLKFGLVKSGSVMVLAPVSVGHQTMEGKYGNRFGYTPYVNLRMGHEIWVDPGAWQNRCFESI